MIHSYENAASLISCVLSNSSGGTWPSVHGRSLGRAPRLTCCTPWGDTWRWMACCTPGTESPAPSCICWSRASPEAAAGADSRPPALSPLTSVAWSWGSCYPPWADLLKLKCEIMYRKIVLKLDWQFYFQVWFQFLFYSYINFMEIRSTVDGRLHNEHPHQKMSVFRLAIRCLPSKAAQKQKYFRMSVFYCKYNFYDILKFLKWASFLILG